MIGKNSLNFRSHTLFKGDQNTGWSVVPDKKIVGLAKMYRVRWPDGVLSVDYYNYTRARDHAARLYAEGQNKAPSSPADAFVGGES